MPRTPNARRPEESRTPRRTAPAPSLARQMLVWQAVVVVALVAGTLVAAVLGVRERARSEASELATAVAVSVAADPSVVDAVASADPTSTLQPLAERVRQDTGVDFVVVMSLTGVRWTHPDPGQIGRAFVGDVGSAPDGRVFTQEYTGTLGPSVRAVAPVRDGADVVALVAVGITLTSIGRDLWWPLAALAASGLLVLGLGLGAAVLISRRLGRQTYGLDERELTRMYEYHNAVLHAVREGLILLDRDHRVELVNAEARRLLGLPADALGRTLGELGLPPALTDAVAGGAVGSDDVYVVGGRALVASSSPARWDGRTVGAVVTLRDRTELQQVSGELDAERALSEGLRAHTHEAANRLHTVLSLVELGRTEEAVEFATEELQIAQMLADQIVERAGDPAVAALLLGKTAEAAARGVTLEVTGSGEGQGRREVGSRSLLTVVGNLVDNALDAVTGVPDARVRVGFARGPDRLVVTVEDNGPGFTEVAVREAMTRGWSSKAGPPGSRGIGLALVSQIAEASDGSTRVDRSPLGGARVRVTLGSSS